MINMMSVSSDGFGWASIILFTSAVCVAASQRVELQTIPQVSAQCGKNATLTCDATSSKPWNTKLFSWVAANKTVCQYEKDQADPDVLCESTVETFNQGLTLTLLNVMPVNQGMYLCKLRSNMGVNSALTVVTVQDCLEGFGSFINKSHAECMFSGVYPSGTVHWFRGDDNLTDSASTQEEADQHGRFNVLSTIDVQEGNMSELYTCSLWIPSTRKHLSTLSLSQQLLKTGELESSGSNVAGLQWICMMVEILMVKFMT